MWWSDWPTPWILVAPLLMLACLACMFFMMRCMHGPHRSNRDDVGSSGIDLARTGPHVAARFPEGQPAFEEFRAEPRRGLDRQQDQFQDFLGRLRTAKDKAESEQPMAEGRTPPSSEG